MNIPQIKSKYKKINDLMTISYLPKIINSALDVGLFEALQGGSKTLEEIIEITGTMPGITEALIQVLYFADLVEIEENGYSLTRLSKDFLLEKSDANQIFSVKMYGGSTGVFDNLTDVLYGGSVRFNNKMWASKERACDMEQQMKSGMIQALVSFVKEIPEFFDTEKMCDIAGNIGYYSLALMELNKKLKSDVYDLPEVCNIAKEIRHKEIEDRKLSFIEFNLDSFTGLDKDYDLFFCSHFLYELGANNELKTFIKKISKSVKQGGLFISNHISLFGFDISMAITDLMTKTMGYPTHRLPADTLKNALEEAGFGNFMSYQTLDETPYPSLILAATKL